MFGLMDHLSFTAGNTAGGTTLEVTQRQMHVENYRPALTHFGFFFQLTWIGTNKC